MAILKVDTISGIGTEGPVFEGDIEFTSQNFLTLPKGDTTQRISTSSGISTETAAVRYNTDSNKMECYIGSTWMEVAVSSPNLDGGARAIFSAGRTASGSPQNTMDYITISSQGNAIDFGDSTDNYEAQNVGACASNTRGMNAGGYSNPAHKNDIGFTEIASTGNHADFGDLTVTRRAIESASSQTRGLFCMGLIVGTYYNTIDYVTIASTGNAVDFGDATVTGASGGGMSSPTRGVFTAGDPSASAAAMFVTIASLGNAQDFGDDFSPNNRYGASTISNQTRGFVGGGVHPSPTTIVSYVSKFELASLGNATRYADLSTTTRSKNGAGSPTRGVFAGGRSPADSDSSPSGPVNGIEYISMQTEGNAADFGDLTQARYEHCAFSNAHGGL